MRRSIRTVLLATTLALPGAFAAGCAEEELDPPRTLRDVKPNANAAAVPQAFACTKPEARALVRDRARRLTKQEIQSSLEDLLGGALMASPEVQSALQQVPDESPGDLAKEFQDAYAVEHSQALLLLGDAIAEAVMTSPTDKTRVFGACAAAATVDEACAKSFLDGWATKLVRRPLGAERATRLLPAFRTASAANGGEFGLRAVFMVLLESPEFLYHLEQGRGICEGEACAPEASVNGRTALDDYAIADRVSFAVTGSTPDDALLAAAAKKELRTLSNVEAHVKRLLATPKARTRFGDVIDSWLMAKSIPDPSPVMAKVAGIDGAGLKVEARQELIDFANYVVFDENGNLDALASESVGFPRSERMAKLYGSPVAAGNAPVKLPNGHGGLLLRVSTLMSGRTESSPIQRGVYVRKRLLCDPLPSPDFAVVAQRTKELGVADRTKLTGRQIAEQLTSPPACASCHTRINPLGFALEGFDPLGRPRAKEFVYSEQGSILAEHPLDLHTTGLNIETGAPEQANDAVELGSAIAHSNKLRECVVQRMYMTAHLRSIAPEDACALGETYKLLQGGGSMKEAFAKTIANEEILWRKDVGAQR